MSGFGDSKPGNFIGGQPAAYEPHPVLQDARSQIPQTYGEKAVLSYPSADPNVDRLKRLYAEVIDILKPFCTDAYERSRLAAVAITEAQTAQMWAVKAVTYRD